MYIYQPERFWSRKIKRIRMETMKKITSVEQAIALFEKYAIKREGAIHCGNSKKLIAIMIRIRTLYSI